MPDASEAKTLRNKRTITPRPVTFRCEWCGEESTELRYPGPVPRYHAGCKHEAQNALAAGRVRRMRAAARDGQIRRPVGRPRKAG